MNIRSKWIEMFYKTATGSRKIRNFFTPLGALFYGFLVFSFIFISLQVDKLIDLTEIFLKPYNIILSLPVFLTALFLIGWSALNFLRVKGTPVPFKPPPNLVTSGPYAYTRNPMLTGVFALLFGFGIFYGSVSLIFIFTPVFILFSYWELKYIEEPELEKRLGQEYIEYRKRTPMFFPDFRKIFKKQ